MTKSTTLVPVFTKASGYSNIIYDGNGNSSGSVPPLDTFSSGSYEYYAGNTGGLVKTGKAFDGWNTSADGTGQHYNPGDYFFNYSDKNVVLYADWVTEPIFDSQAGKGWEPSNPFLIPNEAQLTQLAEDVNSGINYVGCYFALTADIALTDPDGWTPIGNNSQSFSGSFDGEGHKVTGLKIGTEAIPNSSLSSAGLFGNIDINSTIKNVGIDAAIYSSTTDTAMIGGLAGESTGTIINCYATGSVNCGSESAVGGLVGDNEGTIMNSYATAAATGGSYSYDGGLAGYNDNNIANSYATGSVTGDTASDDGGLAGYDDSNISNSYATGSVTGADQAVAGGIVGDYEWGDLTDSYWNSDATAQDIGYDDVGSTTNTMVAKSAIDMATKDFSDLLNTNIGNNSDWAMWKHYGGINSSFPVLFNIGDGVPVTAPSLGASASANGIVGSTSVTATTGASDNLYIYVSSAPITIPNVGDPDPAGTLDYTTGGDITGVSAGQYVAVYEIDSSDTIVKFSDIRLTAGDIKTPIPAPELVATASTGDTAGSTQIAASAGSGDSLAVHISSSATSNPFAGDPLPGDAATYITGSDIAGVSSGQYVAVYEVDSGNKIVKFSDVMLTSGDIKAQAFAPSILTQPLSRTVVGNQNAALSVTVSGTAPLSYQWYKDGTAISGANSSTFTLNVAQAADTGSYTVKVSNSVGHAVSDPAVVTIDFGNPDNPASKQLNEAASGGNEADVASNSVDGIGSGNVGVAVGNATLNIPASVISGLTSDDLSSYLKFTAVPSAVGTVRSIETLLPAKNTVVASLDLNLTKIYSNGTSVVIHQLGGKIKVTLSLTAAESVSIKDASSSKLYYFNAAANTLDPVEATFDIAAKTVTFYTDHLSTYVIGTSATPTGGTVPNPKTGDSMPIAAEVGALLAVTSAAIAFRRRKRSR